MYLYIHVYVYGDARLRKAKATTVDFPGHLEDVKIHTVEETRA